MACHKGGVGKTTTAASVGGILASRGFKVLLVDLDAQKNLTDTFSGEAFPETMANAFSGRKSLPVYPIRENLFLAPSSDDMCSIDINYGSVAGKEFILKKLLAPVKRNYDYVIIDSPAQLGTATANALVAADEVVIPINSDAYSMGGLNQICDLIDAVKEYYNPDLDVLGILLTKFNGRRIFDRKVKEALAAGYADKIFGTVIRESAAIVQAPLCRMDVQAYDPASRGAEDYNAFCDEILRRIK